MNVLQIILITLLAALKKIDQKGPQVFIYHTVFWGALANVIKLRNDEPSGYYCLDGIFI